MMWPDITHSLLDDKQPCTPLPTQKAVTVQGDSHSLLQYLTCHHTHQYLCGKGDAGLNSTTAQEGITVRSV